jgi:diguanylate cyclase (GGDEF)-like protein
MVTTLFIVGTAVFLMAMIKERVVAEQRSIAQTDNLTGLANRGALMASGAAIVRRALMGGAPVAAVLFDLDAFKSVNDTYGHRVGDHVLQRFAAAAVAGLRPNDIIGRIGGEEFLAVIPSASLETAVAIADRVRRNFLEAAAEVDGKPVGATVSAGVAISRQDPAAESLEEMLDRADRALYAAKAAGRNRVRTEDAPVPPDTNIVRLA